MTMDALCANVLNLLVSKRTENDILNRGRIYLNGMTLFKMLKLIPLLFEVKMIMNTL